MSGENPDRRPTSTPSGKGDGDRAIVWVLGMLVAFGPMSIDMYLPSLPSIAEDFATPTGNVQLTLSAFFVGFALGQLFYGPLSDRFGRRPMLIFGICLYVLTSALCALSPNIETLIGFRLLHAMGGGAGTVVARAVVRDKYDTDRGAQVLSMMMFVMGLAPLLAPLVGGYLLKWFGWRSIFWVLTGFGVLCLVAVLARLPESNPSERRSTAGFRGMVAGYAGILGHKTAVGCILTGGFAFAGMFAYISGTPFVYIQIFGVPPEAYGYLFALNVVSIMGCAVLNAKLVMRIGTVRLMDVGVGLGMAASLALLAAALSGAGGLVGIVVPLFFYVGSLGLIGANAIARASEWFPRQAGATAALFGAVQFGLGAIAGFAVGQWYDDTPVPMAVVIAVCGAMTLGSHVWLVRRDQPASSG